MNRPGQRLFVGRTAESAVLTSMLDTARGGAGGAIVVLGEAGAGKSALIDHVLAATAGFRTLRASVPGDGRVMPFAAVRQLCAALSARIDALPVPQRTLLRAVLDVDTAAVADVFRVGLALLDLLAGIARDQPVVCVVDDVHSVDPDSMRALSFVARRIRAEPLAFVFAVREPAGPTGSVLAGLPRLTVGGLGNEAARSVLTAGPAAPADRRVQDRIIAEARGNPAVLRESGRHGSPGSLAGGFAVARGPAAPHLRERFERRIAPLASPLRWFLLLAAADPLGDPMVLWRAMEQQGIGADMIASAESAGLLRVGVRVEFCHPVLRSVVYRGATGEQRAAAHGVLAAAVDPDHAPESVAWHRAHAGAGPGDDAAALLDRTAGRAGNRGGPSAVGAFLRRAAELTTDPSRRAARALAAAQAYQRSSHGPEVAAALQQAESGPLDRRQRAHARVVRARMVLQDGEGGRAAALLLSAVRDLDPGRRVSAHLEAFAAALLTGRSAPGSALHVVSVAGRTLASPGPAGDPAARLLTALCTRVTDGFVAAAPLLRDAVAAFLGPHLPDDQHGWLWLACQVATDLGDVPAWRALARRQIAYARRVGAPSLLPSALGHRTISHVYAGDFALAAQSIREAAGLGARSTAYGEVLLAAWRGDEAELTAVRATNQPCGPAAGAHLFSVVADHATAVLHLGHGRFAAALTAASRAVRDDGPGVVAFGLQEYVEAAVLAGRIDLAGPALDRLVTHTRAAGTGWAAGVERRSRALLTDGVRADGLYREAAELLDDSGVFAEAARVRLLQAEGLLRARRFAQARSRFGVAQEELTRMGAVAFARRAALGMAAAGGSGRRRGATPGFAEPLTHLERRVAQKIAEGLTTKEAAQALDLSPREVDAHLRNVFRKLAVSSRGQLRDRGLPAEIRV